MKNTGMYFLKRRMMTRIVVFMAMFSFPEENLPYMALLINQRS